MPARVSSHSRQSGTMTKAAKDLTPARTKKLSQPPASKKAALQSLISSKGDAKKPVKVTANGTKHNARLQKLDEATAVIGNNTGSDVDMEEMSDSKSDESEEDSDDASDEQAVQNGTRVVEKANGVKSSQVTLSSAPKEAITNGHVEEEDEAEVDGEPSFGELLENATIDVDNALAIHDADAQSLAIPANKRALSIPSATSLGTVLTQALRTNDKDLIESCFQINDLDSVRSTIERLESHLVANLLQRLAERLHKKPGRAANLMVWVQWSLVAHGGYLASQPDVVRKLQDLNRVIKERASGLQPLLSLKGKLDMLSAQLELRRNMQRSMVIGDDDDEAVIYVEGEESESEDDNNISTGLRTGGTRGKGLASEVISDSGDDGLDMPTLDDNLEEEEASDDDSEQLLDDEAEVTDRDSGDEMSEVESEDDDDDEELSEEETQPAKRTKVTARSALAGRR